MGSRLQPHAATSPAIPCARAATLCTQACNLTHPRCIEAPLHDHHCDGSYCLVITPTRCVEEPLHDHHRGRALLRHVVLYFHPSDGEQ